MAFGKALSKIAGKPNIFRQRSIVAAAITENGRNGLNAVALKPFQGRLTAEWRQIVGDYPNIAATVAIIMPANRRKLFQLPLAPADAAAETAEEQRLSMILQSLIILRPEHHKQ